MLASFCKGQKKGAIPLDYGMMQKKGLDYGMMQKKGLDFDMDMMQKKGVMQKKGIFPFQKKNIIYIVI